MAAFFDQPPFQAYIIIATLFLCMAYGVMISPMDIIMYMCVYIYEDIISRVNGRKTWPVT